MIPTLTPEQEALMFRVRDEYIDLLMSPPRIDRAAVTAQSSEEKDVLSKCSTHGKESVRP